VHLRTVLGLFDGVSCGQVALQQAGITYDRYLSSEIDPKAIAVAEANFPATEQLGDINDWRNWDLPDDIDLVMGGSPCQGFSFAGSPRNFGDPRSQLFFRFAEIVEAVQPRFFLLENVKMSAISEAVITERLGVEPLRINSRLVSPQSRQRLYWTNIPGITLPEDQQRRFSDILQPDSQVDPKYWITAAHLNRIQNSTDVPKGFTAIDPEIAVCMTARQITNWKGNYHRTASGIRKITPLEAERLQTLPDNYTASVADTHRYRLIGNGWTVAVIAHLFSFMEESE